MIEVGRGKRSQPASPHVVFETLTEPDRGWSPLADEQRPRLLKTIKPDLVVWSSLWVRRPDAAVRFDLPAEPHGQGTELCWSLLVAEPAPDAALVGHPRTRLNQLINANLRSTFGQ